MFKLITHSIGIKSIMRVNVLSDEFSGVSIHDMNGHDLKMLLLHYLSELQRHPSQRQRQPQRHSLERQ